MDRIRQDLQSKLSLNSEPPAQSSGLTLIQMAEAMEQIQMMDQKKSLRDRLKAKIDFTPDEGLKPVIQSGEIQKEQKSFDQKYILAEKLGEGAHAIVRKGIKRTKNQAEEYFAVKIFRSGDPEIINTIKRTYNISRFLHHPSVASTYELYINEKTEIANLVMEYCPYPSLDDVIKKRKRVSEEYVRHLATNLLEAVNYIHQKGISHRDIKPDNILVNEVVTDQPMIKLVDFGVSKRFLITAPGKVGTVVHEMWTRTGNMYYCAPEIFYGTGYSASIDVWAIGVVLYQCLTGNLPFLEDSEQDTIQAIRRDNGSQYQTQWFKVLTKSCQDFIKRLLRPDPKLRISVEEALQHPFLTLNSSESLLSKTRDDGMIQTSNKKHESLTKSSQMAPTMAYSPNFSHLRVQHRQTDYIREDEDEQSPAPTRLRDKLNQFKEETQLTTVHVVKKPEDGQFGAINLEGSYQTFMVGKGITSGMPSLQSSYTYGSHKAVSMTGFPGLSASSEIKEDPNEDDYQTKNNLDELLMGGIETSVVFEQTNNPQTFSLDLALELGCPLTKEEVDID